MTQCQMGAFVVSLRSIAKRELSIGHGELSHIIDAAADQIGRLAAENERLRAALEKIAFLTGGIDTPATSNAAHYEAVNALNGNEQIAGD